MTFSLPTISETTTMLSNFEMLAILPENTRLMRMNDQGLLARDNRFFFQGFRRTVTGDQWVDAALILKRDIYTATTFKTDLVELNERVQRSFIRAYPGLQRLHQTYVENGATEAAVMFKALVEEARPAVIARMKKLGIISGEEEKREGERGERIEEVKEEVMREKIVVIPMKEQTALSVHLRSRTYVPEDPPFWQEWMDKLEALRRM